MAAIRILLTVAALAHIAGRGMAQDGAPPTEGLIRQGLIALQARDIPKAQGFLERAVEQAPSEARAWIGLAQIYRILNLHRDAFRHAEKAEQLGEDSPLIQHALSMFYVDYRNWAEAARWEEKFARGSDGNLDAHLSAMSLYLQADMPLNALSVGKAALEDHRESGSLHNALGKAYTLANQPEQGVRHLQLAVEALPYEESVHYDLGYFHLRQQEFDAAADAFIAGKRYFDKSAAIEIGLGIARYGQRSFEAAVGHFLRAAELAPGFEQPHAMLGRLLQHATDRIDQVEVRMRAFYESQSASHFGPFLYGRVLIAKLGVRRDPDQVSKIEELLSVLLEKKRDFDAARTHLERAADLNPSSSKPHYRLARVYQRLGMSTEAKRRRDLHKRAAEQERQAMRAGGLPTELANATGR